MTNMEKQLAGYRLTTVEITYRMPDHHDLLQTYLWQGLDLAPEYPVLRKFLKFWEQELDGPLYSVKVAGQPLIAPARARYVNMSLSVH